MMARAGLLLLGFCFSACLGPTKAGDTCGEGRYGTVTSQVACPAGLLCARTNADSEYFQLSCVVRCDAGCASRCVCDDSVCKPRSSDGGVESDAVCF
jgi:hypothetical protein